jgi:hypothetical protein
MLETLFSSQTMQAVDGSGMTTFSRPIAVGENNYANLSLNVRDIEELQGTPSVSLAISGEGSNDGQNWVAITGLAVSGSAVGVSYAEAYVLYPWMRFDVTFTVSGSSGDRAAVVFCLQVNTLRKG